MNLPTSEFLEKMRQQFDNAPYPRTPLEEFPKNPKTLYIHSLTTAYYRRNQRVVSPEGKLILDAGCGTGYKSLELAIANPGARIVGIDLSEASINLARQRLKYHGIENVEFHAMSLENLPTLGMHFDYINNDEVLYLLSDPIAGLQAMRRVLKPGGILRTNFHSSRQRTVFLNAQAFFKQLGLMNGAEPEADIQLVRQTMQCVKNQVYTKMRAWNADFETDDGAVLANHLLDGDKGWTIPEFFAALRSADLEFISMVNWRDWDLLNLFTDVDELPLSIVMALSEKSIAEQLHLYELLHPFHRLFDLWCGHESETPVYSSIEDWTSDQWRSAMIHLNPQLKTTAFREGLIYCMTELKALPITNYLQLVDSVLTIDSLSASCLFPLLEMPRSIHELVQRWQQIRPINPMTLEPIPEPEAFELVKQLLLPLEKMGYVMIESLR